MQEETNGGENVVEETVETTETETPSDTPVEPVEEDSSAQEAE